MFGKKQESTNELFVPRLAVGNHFPGEGIGCVMNLMAWEQGRYINGADTNADQRYDQPAGYLPAIRNALITVNDGICPEVSMPNNLLLCVNCSSRLIDLAHLFSNSQKLYNEIHKSGKKFEEDLAYGPNGFTYQLNNLLFYRHNHQRTDSIIAQIKSNYLFLCQKYEIEFNNHSLQDTQIAYQKMTKGLIPA